MLIIHQSRELSYRNPFGAVPVDSVVELRIKVDGEGSPVDAAYLGYAHGLGHFYSGRLLMDKAGDGFFSCRLPAPGSPALLFYWFEVESGGSTSFLVRDRDANDGSGRLWGSRPEFRTHERFSQSAFQITVYSDRFDTPEWLQGAVIYQVFPDRFARGGKFSPAFGTLAQERPERIYHKEWNEEVDFHGKPETGYIACDFYGGSLQGIEENLDHIASLGAEVLYLNPVFEARSNHRYDTADYLRVDPMLGTEDDLARLCKAAAEKGIRIVLDGVFSHTGADSVYFNRYRRYPYYGAYQEALGEGRSVWTSWYSVRRKGAELQYDAWWGFPELPSVNKEDLSYRSFILGENGVIRRWMRLGVSGWRIDVSDELPDAFLRDLRRAARLEKQDAAVIGEVWEDASNKVSYGAFRDFAFGSTHDSVMGYPFRNSLIHWLIRRSGANNLVCELEHVRENYPAPMFYCVMNLVGSHDVPRALTALSGRPDPGSRELQAAAWLTPEELARSKALLRLAVVFQSVYPGAPSIYYGDEAGMEGFRDPFNRRTFPWDCQDRELTAHFARCFGWRKAFPVLRTGECEMLAEDEDVVFIRRRARDGRDVFGKPMADAVEIRAWVNRSDKARSIDRDGVAFCLGPMEAGVFAGRERIL